MQVLEDARLLRSCRNVPDTLMDNAVVQQVCDSADAGCAAADPAAPICQAVSTIQSTWLVQLHIRQYGGCVTRINVNAPEEFDAFFASNPTGVWTSNSSCNACSRPYGHSVLLVGYNNTAEPPHWIALNSHGPSWGDGGLFRIAYGQAGERLLARCWVNESACVRRTGKSQACSALRMCPQVWAIQQTRTASSATRARPQHSNQCNCHWCS